MSQSKQANIVKKYFKKNKITKRSHPPVMPPSLHFQEST